MTSDIEEQALAFLQGLEEVVPKEALELLNEKELGLHLTGMPTVDCKERYRTHVVTLSDIIYDIFE